MAAKPHCKMIYFRHIDNGKSTTMGHFLMDLGVVDERTIAQHAEESEKTGKGDTFKYAWVMDNIKEVCLGCRFDVFCVFFFFKKKKKKIIVFFPQGEKEKNFFFLLKTLGVN